MHCFSLIVKIQMTSHAWHRDVVFVPRSLNSSHSSVPILQLGFRSVVAHILLCPSRAGHFVAAQFAPWFPVRLGGRRPPASGNSAESRDCPQESARAAEDGVAALVSRLRAELGGLPALAVLPQPRGEN